MDLTIWNKSNDGKVDLWHSGTAALKKFKTKNSFFAWTWKLDPDIGDKHHHHRSLYECKKSNNKKSFKLSQNVKNQLNNLKPKIKGLIISFYEQWIFEQERGTSFFRILTCINFLLLQYLHLGTSYSLTVQYLNETTGNTNWPKCILEWYCCRYCCRHLSSFPWERGTHLRLPYFGSQSSTLNRFLNSAILLGPIQQNLSHSKWLLNFFHAPILLEL